MSRIVLVAGATGAQGGSVVDHLLRDNKWKVRALTRDPSSERAKALLAKGVEVVKGNIQNKDEIRAALKGVYAFFAVTNFWDPQTMGHEFELGKGLVDLSKEAGIQHFIWSSLPNADKISNGKWHVPHFTDKAKVEEYCKQSGIRATYVHLGFYFQNFRTFFPPKEENGVHVFSLPLAEDGYLTGFDVADIGEAVVTVLNNPNEYMDKDVPLAGSHMHPQEYVKIWSEVKGRPARYNPIPLDEYAKLSFPGAEEMAHMFGYFQECTFFGPPFDVSLGRKACPHIKTWRQYLEKEGSLSAPQSL